MSDRAVSRHRAPQRAVTPLTDLTESLTGQLATVGRSGAIVAMSTGLVASVSVPAQAVAITSAAAGTGVGATVAPMMTATAMHSGAMPASTGRAGLLRSAGPVAGSSISAPSAAIVSFERGAFRAAPNRVRKSVRAIKRTTRTATARASRSGVRTRTPVAARPAARKGAAGGSSVLAIAARYVGVPYVYGGTSPRGFDCSGYTGYVYRQLGVSLPRTANEQMLATRRIPRSQARIGDLVFFVSGGRAYHNGIYAGNGMMYDAPRSGKTLQKRKIWSAAIVFTRVTG